MGKGTSSSSRCCWIHPEGFNPCNPLPLPCAITCRVSQKILIHRDPRVPLLATPEFHPASEGVSQAFLIRICLWKTFGDTKRGFFGKECPCQGCAHGHGAWDTFPMPSFKTSLWNFISCCAGACPIWKTLGKGNQTSGQPEWDA